MMLTSARRLGKPPYAACGVPVGHLVAFIVCHRAHTRFLVAQHPPPALARHKPATPPPSPRRFCIFLQPAHACPPIAAPYRPLNHPSTGPPVCLATAQHLGSTGGSGGASDGVSLLLHLSDVHVSGQEPGGHERATDLAALSTTLYGWALEGIVISGDLVEAKLLMGRC